MKRAFAMAVVLTILVFAGLPHTNLRAQAAAQTPPLRVLSSAGVKTLLDALGPQCQSAAGRPLAINYGTSVATKQAAEAGGAFDVIILVADPMNALEKEDKLIPRSRVDFARTSVGVGIRVGLPNPDIATPEGMKRTLLAAKAIAMVKDGAAIPVVDKMTDRLGITDQVKRKIVLRPTSDAASALVANGSADLIFNLVSEIVPIHTIELAAPIPSTFDRYVTFAAAIGAKSANPRSAAALLRFLASPAVAPALKAKGLEPPGAAK